LALPRSVRRVSATDFPAEKGASRGRLRSVSATDAAVALAVGVAQFGGAAMHWHHQPTQHQWNPLAVVLLAVGPAAMLVRRRHPVAVLGVTYATAFAYWLVGYGRGPLFPALIVALITTVFAGHRRAAIAGLLAGFVGFLWLGPLVGQYSWPPLDGVLGLAAWLLVLFAAAEALRVRQVRAAERAQVRAAEARRAVSEERLRIARELHDVLAHNISLINVQAGTALHRAERSAERAYDALGIIKRVSQDTLIEMRSLLGALREVDEAAPRAPAPTLAHLDDLVASAAAAGVAAHIETSGTPRALPTSLDLAAFRIVQEALTNVSRHAGTASADVRVVYGDEDLVIRVDDNGKAVAPPVAGTGITGMTERVAALGGELMAGPRPAGGFRVEARLPLPSRP
jgi:signal transduction histidine kinase